ncbi:hypothetical protein [uncultured Tenacibaculum sp.]|uniref:hypothetical protein n=1 Tax=uncultured Tenacibaculum sp. TaxID=174713 RepID=UPI0026212657|nr:hypothetical protein [uncultured Tenacibaculum sp.]
MTIEILRGELKKVSDIAPNGSHVKVANEVGVSKQYLYQIRVGKNLKSDTEEARELMNTIISSYRGIIRREADKYNEVN